ncbi:uncharacterized protein LOC127737626 [Mytilus californianus]|uniref:uncharacterized protein LOC127737626 n=1 Tax=Mytilus californianus TaxID=6549 RepID=UPI0022459BD4|nr:uncharacterized protein LOC127737626 [Mytilus californianus]
MKALILFVVCLSTVSVIEGTLEEDLDKLQQDFSNWLFSENPQFATSINIHNYDDRIDDYSLNVFDRWKNAVDSYLQQLAAIPRNSLSEKYKIDFDIFENFLKTYQEGYNWKDYNSLNPINFLEGPHVDPDYLVSITPQNTRGDFENFVARIEGFPNQLHQIQKRFEKAVLQGNTYHNVSIFKVPSMIDHGITSRPEDFSFYSPFNGTLENITTIPNNIKTDLRTRAKIAIIAYFQSLRDVKTYLKTEYFQHLRDSYGVSGWNNGSDYYKSVLQWHLSLPLTPDEVHQKGLDEVDRISKQMKKIMANLGLHGSVKEAFDTIKNDSRFYLKTGADILARFNHIIHEEIEPKLPLMFKNIPDLPVEVRPMPNDGPGGQYIPGTADGSRPGVFQVNLMHPDEMLTIDFMALSIHETNPGHHLQISTALLAKIADFRRYGIVEKYFQAPALFPFYTAFVEGWALYAESLGEEMGLYKDEYDLLGRYASEVFRACRLVVDTGLHSKNWTRQQAIDYMATYTAYGESAIATEIDRYITWPGQACAYKIGELKIRELRNKARAELGELFDIRDFHAVVLENGALPLSTLETIVDDWIERSKIANARTSEHPVEDLDKLETDFSNWLLSKNPGTARYLNIHVYDEDVRDFSLQSFDDLKEDVDSFLMKLNNIPRSALNEKNKVDFDIFKDTLMTYHDGYKWGWYAAVNPINFLEGPQIDPSGDVDVLPKNMNLTDFESFITRIGKYPVQMNQFKARMDKAISEGHTNHNASMFRVLKRFEDIITSQPEAFPLYQPFNETLDNTTSITDDEKTELRRRAKEVIQKYLTSLTEMKDYIQNTYMKHLRQAFGVNVWIHGNEFYEACLRWHLSLPLKPEEVHQKGIDEVHRISLEIQKIFKRLNLTGTTKEVFDVIKHDPKFLLNNTDAILEDYKDIIFNRIQPNLPKLFKNIPNLPLEVRPSLTDGPGGTYQQVAPDGSRPGIFYANLFHPNESPTFNFVDLALHEALPGHHLQLSYQGVAKIPLFRTTYVDWTYMVPTAFPSYTAYIEGWALYAESLGEEMGVFENDYERLGRYSAEIFRACRLVVDTGLHYYNWTEERAINYMLNFTAYGQSDITNEVNRYITWPGQACAYKIGELKIRELRAKAEKELGDRFKIDEFHLVVLQNGAMPLSTLETIIDSWIDQVKNTLGATETPEDKLNELQNSFSEWLLAENPEFATIINDRRYDDRLDDYSIELFDRWKNRVDSYLDQLSRIQRDRLTPKLKVDYDIFKDFLQTYHDGYEWRMYNALNPINFLEGPQSDPDTVVKNMAKHTKGDFENFITRIQNMPIQLNQMKDRFTKAIEVNHTYNKVSIDKVPKTIREMITEDSESFVLYKPFTDDLDQISTINQEEKESIREKAKIAITHYMRSLHDMEVFINETYLNHTRPGFGVGSWDKGMDYYIACLKWHTSLPLSPEEVHRKGLEEVSRISTQMKAIFRKMGMTGSIKDGFNQLKNDSSFFLKTEDEVVSTFEDIIQRQIEPKLNTLFKDNPNLPLVVEPMPYDGPLGTYTTGSPDGTKPGTFQVNGLHPAEMATFGFMALALHETVPGHHLQISIQSLAKKAGFRRNGLDSKYFQPPTLFPFYTAFVEGWALYAEYLGEEMGVYKTDAQMLGRYSEEIFRACRLVVDTGLHYMGWSRKQAIDYMSNYTASGENELSNEIDRYITWPGQACAYKIGELKIKELRKKAEDELGNTFDVKDFHSVVLKNGPMPLTTLETVIHSWIEEVKNKPPATPPNRKTNTNTGCVASSNLYLQSLLLFIIFHFVKN